MRRLGRSPAGLVAAVSLASGVAGVASGCACSSDAELGAVVLGGSDGGTSDSDGAESTSTTAAPGATSGEPTTAGPGSASGGTTGEPSSAPPVAVSVGKSHTCARLADGVVRCWGQMTIPGCEFDGCIGRFPAGVGYGTRDTIGDDEPASAAGDLALGGPATALASGHHHACAVIDAPEATGAIRCWGANDFGQLGHGSPLGVAGPAIGDDELPTALPPLTFEAPAIAITAGAQHTCALLRDGGVRCWGQQASGTLGLPAVPPSSLWDGRELPANELPRVELGGPAVQLAAGATHTCAVLRDGAIRCWGANYYGQLGRGTGDEQPIGDDEAPAAVEPVRVFPEVVDPAAITLALGSTHTCASDGAALYCWGDGGYGALGYGHGFRNLGDDESPIDLGPLPGSDRGERLGGPLLAAGAASTCASMVEPDGAGPSRLACWGSNGAGALNAATTGAWGDNEPWFVGRGRVGCQAPGCVFEGLAAQWGHACAIERAAGGALALKCWGGNDAGQLGHGNTAAIGDDEQVESIGFVPL
jgi:hypothetical protein